MKLGNFYSKSEKLSFYGRVEGQKVYRISHYGDVTPKGEYTLDALTVLPPVNPGKIIGVGLNYKDHAAEMRDKVPDEPLIFLKPPSAVIAHMSAIIWPDMALRVDYEAELGVVIGKTAKNIHENEVSHYILGYTAFNDVTARDLQSKDGQWARAKGFDTFAPFGPFVETELAHPGNLRIQALLNGNIKQDNNTNQMIFPINKIVSYISQVMTLYPGDVIATGTPPGIGPMQKGDEIRIRIEGLDDLINIVQ